MFIYLVLKVWKDNFELGIKYYFLYISKNVGISIKNVENKLYDIVIYDVIVDDYEDDLKNIVIICDLVDRFVSLYNFVKKGGFNDEFIENYLINKYKDINDFINDLRIGKLIDVIKIGENGDWLDVVSVIYWL